MSENIEKIKCIIIGSGPAGYTAAIYAARADMKPVMYTGLQMGGQLTTTTEVDNFPGYANGTDGTAMMEDLKNQAERFGTEVRFGLVTKVDFSKEVGGIHKITVDEFNKLMESLKIDREEISSWGINNLSKEVFMDKYIETLVEV